MTKVKPGRFYILGIGNRRFWGMPLYYAGSSGKQIITLEYNEQTGDWKETVWDQDQFAFAVEVEKFDEIIPLHSLSSSQKQKSIKSVLSRK